MLYICMLYTHDIIGRYTHPERSKKLYGFAGVYNQLNVEIFWPQFMEQKEMDNYTARERERERAHKLYSVFI